MDALFAYKPSLLQILYQYILSRSSPVDYLSFAFIYAKKQIFLAIVRDLEYNIFILF